MESKRKYSIGLVISVVLLLGLLILFVVSQNFQKKKTQASDVQKDEDYDEWDVERFRLVVDNSLPDVDDTTRNIIIAQAIHETGGFTSPVFFRNNNAFGMKLAEKRPTTAIGDIDKDNYANYDSIEDSIEDLKLWFDFHAISLEFDTVQEYSQTIRSKGYYTAAYNIYTSALKKHFNDIT